MTDIQEIRKIKRADLPKVTEFYNSKLGDQDVLRLHITMDNLNVNINIDVLLLHQL